MLLPIDNITYYIINDNLMSTKKAYVLT